MFEKASRLKLRYDYKGLCSVEDLWDVPIPALNAMFQALNAQHKAQAAESLLDTSSKEDEILTLKIAIIRHVVAVRLHEAEVHMAAAAKADRKQKLLGVIARKQDAAFEEMSVDDLTKLVSEL